MGENGVMEWGREALRGNGQGGLVTENRVGDYGLRTTTQGVQLWRRCSVYDRETPRFAWVCILYFYSPEDTLEDTAIFLQRFN